MNSIPLSRLIGTATLALVSTAALSATGAGTPPPTTPTIIPIQMAPLPSTQKLPAQMLIRPKLTGLTFTPAVYAPGANVTLTANLTGELKGSNCKFVANVFTAGDSNAINTQTNSAPIQVTANLPQMGLTIPVGAMPSQGKYRMQLNAVTPPGQPQSTDCEGSASGEFELKRPSLNLNGMMDINSITVLANGYEKTNKIWNVEIKGQSAACAYSVEFKNDVSGQTYEKKTYSQLPVTWAFDFPTEPAYGNYTVTIKPWTVNKPQNIEPCTGVTSTKTRRDLPADAIKITNSSMNLMVSGKKYFYANDASVAASDLTAIDVQPYFTNPYSGQQGCTYSIKIAKGGQELVLPFHSSAYPSIYPAMKQKFNMATGDYTITVVSTPADYKPGTLSCLGATDHKLTVTDKPTITAVTPSFYKCSDSNCHVMLTTTISGSSACTYSMSMQKPGHAATVFPVLMHNAGQPDVAQFNFYNGPVPPPPAAIAALKAETHFIKVYSTGGVVGCAGEASIGPVHLMQ